MSNTQAPPGSGSANGSIAPPSELPSFFAQQKKGPGIPPPVPPQLHPFPQPTITVAPPTPCPPVVPPPIGEPSRSQPAQIPVTSESVTPPVTQDVKVTTMQTNQTSKHGNGSPQPPTVPQTIAVGLTEVEDSLDKLEEEEGSGMLGWLQKTVTQSSFLSKVADKAKTGMDSVLTTLDPGMLDFLKSDGAIDISIASDNGREITAIADGFRRVFNTVAYRGMGTPGAGSLLPQIVGHTLALKYANERISLLRGSGLAGNTSAVVALQPFLHEIQGSWYESAVIALQRDDVNVHVFTQPVDVDVRVIAKLKEHTPSGFAANAFATSVGNAYAEVYGVEPDDWQQHSLQYSSSELYRLAAAALAASYKRTVYPSES